MIDQYSTLSFLKHHPPDSGRCVRPGRTVSQVENHGILASGKKNYKNKSSFFVRFTYEDLRTVDSDRAPGLYPFMVAASGNTSDLSAVNFLLVRRDPSLAYEGERIVHNNTHKCKR